MWTLVMVVVLVGSTSGASTQIGMTPGFGSRESCESAAGVVRAFQGPLVDNKGAYKTEADCFQMK